MNDKRFSLTVDWWAVFVAAVAVVLIKSNIFPHIPW